MKAKRPRTKSKPKSKNTFGVWAIPKGVIIRDRGMVNETGDQMDPIDTRNQEDRHLSQGN